MDEIKKLKELIERSENIVFFGGAGVSTESGIKDFRSEDGIYNMKFEYPPEYMLSHEFFVSHPDKFFDFYRQMMIAKNVQPNPAHYALAELERQEKLKAVITQNIDGLHQKAGSKTVYELHGTTLKNYCYRCGKSFDIDFIDGYSGVPYCSCGGIVKPDVVLYGEQLNGKTIENAVCAIEKADLLIVGGTSLTVYPAAGLIDYFGGEALVLINRDETPYDNRADIVIREPVGKTLGGIVFGETE
ncbi:MAG: NAD-dependent protein deacylase [Clostridia bacterium]|nr:NAD-dependent protein deacylase [Clostridia bacterium]